MWSDGQQACNFVRSAAGRWAKAPDAVCIEHHVGRHEVVAFQRLWAEQRSVFQLARSLICRQRRNDTLGKAGEPGGFRQQPVHQFRHVRGLQRHGQCTIQRCLLAKAVQVHHPTNELGEAKLRRKIHCPGLVGIRHG
ncbi:MAG: hypothetical protein R3D67_02600 [Hyphomicrobiaceae bacterium]